MNMKNLCNKLKYAKYYSVFAKDPRPCSNVFARSRDTCWLLCPIHIEYTATHAGLHSHPVTSMTCDLNYVMFTKGITLAVYFIKLGNVENHPNDNNQSYV